MDIACAGPGDHSAARRQTARAAGQREAGRRPLLSPTANRGKHGTGRQDGEGERSREVRVRAPLSRVLAAEAEVLDLLLGKLALPILLHLLIVRHLLGDFLVLRGESAVLQSRAAEALGE